MRLFAYYAFHSFINTLKKMFKTWVAVFLICCLAIGLLAGLLSSALSSSESEPDSTQVVTESSEGETGETEAPGIAESHGTTTFQFVETIIAVVILIMWLFNLLNIDSASKLFKPADIPLLFASPIKPQSVMLFRLMNSLGLLLVASVYMIAQIPNLVHNAGLSVWGAFSLVICYGILLISGTLLQVTLYTVASRHPVFKKNATRIITGIYTVIVIGFIVLARSYNGNYIKAAADYFASPYTRFIPFWGWMRGFCMSAIEGNGLWCIIYIVLLLVGFAGLILLIWNLDADFYEDALESAEHTAKLLEDSKSGLASNRKKDRSEKLMRDGFRRGYGANVFFHKTMYNRFRFAICKIFTKTSIVYIAVSALACYILRNVTEVSGFVIVSLLMALLTFYRTLGNPLKEDTSKEFFVMIPATAASKLRWSLLGGSVNCFLDIIIPMVMAAVWLKAGIVTAVIWTLFVLSIDYFGTTVGAFIGISVPGNVGDTLKQLAQFMFLYFGIVPVAVLIVLGFVFDKLVLFMLLAVLVNLIIGTIFFSMTPKYLENGNK